MCGSTEITHYCSVPVRDLLSCNLPTSASCISGCEFPFDSGLEIGLKCFMPASTSMQKTIPAIHVNN